MNYCNKQTSEALIELGMENKKPDFYFFKSGIRVSASLVSADEKINMIPCFGLLEAAAFLIKLNIDIIIPYRGVFIVGHNHVSIHEDGRYSTSYAAAVKRAVKYAQHIKDNNLQPIN